MYLNFWENYKERTLEIQPKSDAFNPVNISGTIMCKSPIFVGTHADLGFDCCKPVQRDDYTIPGVYCALKWKNML
jgi:hypothetical protein